MGYLDWYHKYGYCENYVLPFYIKKDCGNLFFAGTLTLVYYKKRPYFITASHCIHDSYDYKKNGIFLISKHGDINISEYINGLYRYSEYDILIMDVKIIISDHEYIVIDELLGGMANIDLLYIAGYPVKKSPKVIHKTINVKDLYKSKLTTQSMDGHEKERSSINQSLILISKFEEYNDKHIISYNDLLNAEYFYDGKKEKGYSPKGMSGGAIFYADKKEYSYSVSCYDIEKKEFKKQKEINLHFAGILIEHKHGKKLIGVNRDKIIFLLDKTILNKEYRNVLACFEYGKSLLIS